MLVVIESPYKGDVYRNHKYLQACIRDCIMQGEFPFASHQMYVDALNDKEEFERKLGMNAGFKWGAKADKVVVYVDHGISEGMKEGIDRAQKRGQPIEYRKILRSDGFPVKRGYGYITL